MGEVLMWPGTTTHVLSVGRVAEAVDQQNLKLCIVVGVRKDGSFYLASTEGDVAMVLWQLERAKRALFEDFSL